MNVVQRQTDVAHQHPHSKQRPRGRSIRNIALLARLPSFRPLSRIPISLFPETEKQNYPALAVDFAILEDTLLPTFHKLDREAVRLQNAHWWTYIILIAGGALATILGILQLAINVEGFGIAGALVAALLGSATVVRNASCYQQRYMNNRLAAEELRSEYFLFLGHLGPYARQDRLAHLQKRVEEIDDGVDKR